MAKFSLPRLQLQNPITDDQRRATTQFQRFWQDVAGSLETAIGGLQTGQAQFEALADQIQTILETANAALRAAGGGTSGTLTVDIADTWTAGPTVTLLGVSAGTFKATVTLEAAAGASLIGGTIYDPISGSYMANGQFQIVEDPTGAATIIYGPAPLAAYTNIYPWSGDSQTIIQVSNPTDLANFSASLSTEGDVSYQLQLQMEPGVAFHGCNATLGVNRT